MNFNIYIEDTLGKQLQTVVKRQGTTRNKLISQALNFYIKTLSKKWPDDILNFKGVPDFPAFEESRHEFDENDKDPFA